MRENFYDPAMHGVDWNAEFHRVAPYVEAARTPDELRRLTGSADLEDAFVRLAGLDSEARP